MAALNGQVIVITGASSGIGAATAKKLASLGAAVALGARRTDRLEALAKELGPNVLWKATDVSKRKDVEALAAATLERFGRIDALVNNAGIMPVSPLAVDLVDDWDRMIDVNIKGVLYGIHAVLGHMLQRGDGTIINISSVAGLSVGPGSAVYSGTKFAVRAISEGLRKETLGKIRVTTIYPGLIDTELADSITFTPIRDRAKEMYKTAVPAAVIADAIAYVLGQPHSVAINEFVVRPVTQDF